MGATGLAAVLLAGLPTTAGAQLVLPGAVSPTPQGAPATPAAKSKPKVRPVTGDDAPVRKGVPVAVPASVSLAGRSLLQNGTGSQITFTSSGTLAVQRLTLSGETVGGHRESCHVEVPNTPVALGALGRPDGLERLQVSLPACPMAFDVLEGAILVDRAQPACTFTVENCRVETQGLWGPAPGDLGPDRIKSLERSRAAAEAAVRGNYKALAASTKDRHALMGFAHEQAQFSSSREEICRDYADEGRHGYCALKLTEARAAALHDQVTAALDAKAAKKAAKNAVKDASRHGGRGPGAKPDR